MLTSDGLKTLEERLGGYALLEAALHRGGDAAQAAELDLHHVLSDLRPHEALLAIALAARHIMKISPELNGYMYALKIECERIIHEYGPLWLRAAHNPVFEEALLARYEAIAAELEDFTELLDMSCFCLTEPHQQGLAALFDILKTQADAQQIIAEAFATAGGKEQIRERCFSETRTLTGIPEQPGNSGTILTFPVKTASRA